MAEFKKLSEVEKLETASDDASVLVEEGGEIKRVPKKEVGGAGGYVLTISDDNIIDANLSEQSMVWCSENYDELYNILMAGGSAWIDISIFTFEQNNMPSSIDAETSFPTNYAGHKLIIREWFITDAGLCAMVSSEYRGMFFLIIFPNGSHNLPPQENDNPPV